MVMAKAKPIVHIWGLVFSQKIMFAFCFVAIRSFLAEIWQIPYLTLKIQGHGQGQNQMIIF